MQDGTLLSIKNPLKRQETPAALLRIKADSTIRFMGGKSAPVRRPLRYRIRIQGRTPMLLRCQYFSGFPLNPTKARFWGTRHLARGLQREGIYSGKFQ